MVPSQQEILRFLNNEMAAEEAASFIESMAQDPFLQEAVEGFAMLHPENAEEVIADLKQDIHFASERKDKDSWKWVSVAASLLLVVGSCLYLLTEKVTDKVALEAVSSEGKQSVQESITPELALNGEESRKETESISAVSSELNVVDELNEDKLSESPKFKGNAIILSDETEKVVSKDNSVSYSFSTGASSASLPTVEAEGYANITDQTISFNRVNFNGTLKEMLAIAESHYLLNEPMKEVGVEKSEVEKKRKKALKDCATCPPKPDSYISSLPREYALAKFKERDFLVAEKYFNQSVTENPADLEIRFYQVLNMIYLEKNSDARKNIIELEKKLSMEMIIWLKAACSLSEGNNKEAEQMLKVITGTKNRLEEDAKKILTQIK